MQMNIYDVTIERRIPVSFDPNAETVQTIRIACRSIYEARKKANKRIKTSYPNYYIISVKRHW